MPLVFLQSGYRTGKGFGVARALTIKEQKAWIRVWAALFNAAEYSANNLDDSGAVVNIRNFQTALREVAADTTIDVVRAATAATLLPPAVRS